MAQDAARKKKRKEERRKQVDANNKKSRENRTKDKKCNSSRVFTTPTPTFTIGDEVTNKPITAGKKLFERYES